MWKNGESDLDVSGLRDSVAFLIEAAIENCLNGSHGELTPLSLLYPLFVLRQTDPQLAACSPETAKEFLRLSKIIREFLKSGMSAELPAKTIEAGTRKTKEDINPYDRGYWSDGAAAAVESLDAARSLGEFVADVLHRLEEEDAYGYELLGDILDLSGITAALTGSTGTVEVFAPDGALRTEVFSPGALRILKSALGYAARHGKAEVLPVHLLCAVLEDADGYTAGILRRLPAYGLSTGKSLSLLRTQIVDEYDGAVDAPLTLSRESFHPQAAALITGAGEASGEHGEAHTDERRLLAQILQSTDAGLQMLLTRQLKWPVAEMTELVERIRWNPLYAPLPVSACRCRNLSLEGLRAGLVERDDLTNEIVEILFNPVRHNAALYGESGVGKSTMAELLALALRQSASAQLRETPVVSIDLGTKGENESVAQIFSFMEQHPRPIYVLDGVDSADDDFVATAAKRLAKNNYKLAIIVDNAMKKRLEEHKGGTIHLRYVEIEELNTGTAEKSELIERLLDARITEIEERYDVTFEPNVAGYALRLARDYLLSKRFPRKAIDLLEGTATVMRTRADLHGGKKPVIGREALAEQISAETKLPTETILGTGQDKDFTFLLGKGIVGQDHAIGKVADRLDLIQKGMVDTERPAAIFLFAGLSGTGKTELAKQIASVYSSSHKITTYEMNGFKESHATSRIIGVPPGYVGYEEGGKLINDINKDPYSLILFDEVEKAHPAMWDPMMRLFDEGVVEDTRGVTAFGNKCFFVLTSNIGQYEIVRMLREGRPPDEIERLVEDAVGEAVHRESGEKCFRPEFIGRIKRSGGIVIFNSLSHDALVGIVRRIAHKEEQRFEAMREVKLSIDEEVIAFMAERQFAENEAVIRRKGKYLGARPLNPLFDELVMNKLAKSVKSLAKAKMIRVVMDGGTTALLPVDSEDDVRELALKKRSALVERVSNRLDLLSMAEPEAIAAMNDERLLRLDALLAEAGILSGVQ